MKTKFTNKKIVVVFVSLFLFFAAPTLVAQNDKTDAKQTQPAKDDKNKKPRKGSITGKVVDDSGQPLLDAEIQLSPFSNLYGNPSIATVDSEGNFRFENLRAGSYISR